MASRRWGVQTIDKRKLHCYEFITLKKLQTTIKALKTEGKICEGTRWSSPIVPLLMEHIFMETSKDLDQICSITLHLNAGKDIKLC